MTLTHWRNAAEADMPFVWKMSPRWPDMYAMWSAAARATTAPRALSASSADMPTCAPVSLSETPFVRSRRKLNAFSVFLRRSFHLLLSAIGRAFVGRAKSVSANVRFAPGSAPSTVHSTFRAMSARFATMALLAAAFASTLSLGPALPTATRGFPSTKRRRTARSRTAEATASGPCVTPTPYLDGSTRTGSSSATMPLSLPRSM